MCDDCVRVREDAPDCVWCPSTSACASRAFVSELCPRGQWAMRADEAGAAAQKLYSVFVDFTPTAMAYFSRFDGVEQTPVQNNTFALPRSVNLFTNPSALFPIKLSGLPFLYSKRFLQLHNGAAEYMCRWLLRLWHIGAGVEV
ncbi:hypothetical protein ABB37_09143 [Leptomonas pyrrhocoris]|uniref:PSI domain-containing protein n=1 Tax=Leptomonas pyrrhocoris TaxID=157538 RepID=A0A0M9FRD8_LEPPY|nr:hypothetical protein ABB37_09143 [Leptomonas pyrrhocoris]XP_015652903.1 hypothetical protein ABB37_09143 [Leptomonas pyrrhocoris]KPA74463.1 hypothetical protein ABB37_09143 [Leptomonas pyrrhocoris]KPA74464.1 hypothetical protein ABB37_09143 [Leptomonas pyrrhocoris]|eukprot:XP_015652902.1 hypothetical protein ABB37_09143 [Leptomonas pyrrhocoris]